LAQQNPLVMRLHRLMEAFAKADDERDFYLDRHEGFLIFVDLDKAEEELEALEQEVKENPDRYIPITKLTFYEVKKLMEGFVNEKVYDIDTKEKLLEIISSKEARENFSEFIYDHHSELERWQQYYQERFRIRIIEWLRQNNCDFVFEEDLEMPKVQVEKLKLNTFETRVGKDIMAARKILVAKAKTYYSSEALNPRPKRGRPPKQVAKVETEPQFSSDIFMTAPKAVKPFLFMPDYQPAASIFTFSGKYSSEADMLAHKSRDRHGLQPGLQSLDLQDVNQKLATLKALSSQWLSRDKTEAPAAAAASLNGLPRAAKGNTPATLTPSPKSFDDDFADDFAHDLAFPKSRATKKYDAKTEKALEASFFESRKMKEKEKEKVKGPEATKKTQPAKKQAAPEKTKPKVHLRPLKKAAPKAVKKEKAAAPKQKQKTLRHLRPAKKR